jgi:hypothetical protein
VRFSLTFSATCLLSFVQPSPFPTFQVFVSIALARKINMASAREQSLDSCSRGSDTKRPRTLISKISWRRRGQSNISKSGWKPNAFRILPLAAIIIASWALIVTLQLLLVKSQREGGVIIADTLDDIALDKSFLYKYLPTIIALIYSVFWGWIDLQVKRLEPYHQLSKPGGAWGKDSLLLSYPFDFLPLVPISALRKRYVSVLETTRTRIL